MIPSSKPKITPEAATEILRQRNVGGVAIIGIRGYYRDTMGKTGENDRGIYDDAIILISPTAYATFNANTDPTITRKGVAVLKPGVWWYKIGIHGLSKPAARRYKALVQAAKVTVVRDGKGEDTGMFGINIHRGARASTSSLGCQTIPPDQWPSFIGLVEGEMKRHSLKTTPYILIDGYG